MNADFNWELTTTPLTAKAAEGRRGFSQPRRPDNQSSIIDSQSQGQPLPSADYADFRRFRLETTGRRLETIRNQAVPAFCPQSSIVNHQ